MASVRCVMERSFEIFVFSKVLGGLLSSTLYLSRTSSSILSANFFQHMSISLWFRLSPFFHLLRVFLHSEIWLFLRFISRPSWYFLLTFGFFNPFIL